MSRVDVIVPCYKYGHFLPECVESVLGQEGVDVRVLIIDDASPDDSAEVGARLASEDRRIEFRRHLINQGHIATYNEGIDWASGDYLLLLSADDVLIPGAFARATALMDLHPELGLTFGRAITTDRPNFRSHRGAAKYVHRILSGEEFWQISCREGTNIVSTPTAIARTRLQHAIGGYRADLPHTGDLEMWMRFAAHAPVGVLDADQAFYRVHGHNMHKDTFPQRLAVLQQHCDAFEILFREYGNRLENRDELHRMAMRALALGAVRTAGTQLEQGHRDSCELLLHEARRIFPEVQSERSWSRTRWKQRLGRRLVLTVRRLLGTFRKRATIDHSPFGRSGVFAGV
jgi:glycosyltransferase involved in cell wall biosynthesis